MRTSNCNDGRVAYVVQAASAARKISCYGFSTPESLIDIPSQSTPRTKRKTASVRGVDHCNLYANMIRCRPCAIFSSHIPDQ